MSDPDATTPRVFLARHGETEWTKSGQYTGITELDLTPEGVKQVTSTAAHLVGKAKLIDPERVVRVWVSPRKRTQQTFHALFDGVISIDSEKVTLTADIAEWDYGDYEGLLVGEIKASRKEKGLDKERKFDIWRNGCEGGEQVCAAVNAGSPQQITERLDRLISQIRDIQRPYMHGENPADVVLVAHGLILRAFVKRWLNHPLEMPLPMMISPGAIGILSYKNHDINEPGFFIGMALPPQE